MYVNSYQFDLLIVVLSVCVSVYVTCVLLLCASFILDRCVAKLAH
jgi:hypothetical protein